jgi:ABC-type Fe3+-siderophore transport system permease subunit
MAMKSAAASRTGAPELEPQPLSAALESLAPSHLTRARMVATLGALSAATVAILIGACAVGSVHISLARAFTDTASPDHAILFAARMPRVLMGAIVGGILAVVGAALQALVRNPLAEGGILGISGGGALGAILALIVTWRWAASAEIVPLCAFVAALGSTILVYRLSELRGELEPFTLLLVGVILNAFWGAAIMLVNSVVNFYYTHSILFWLMGSLESPSWRELALVAGLGLIGFVVLLGGARDMNLLSLGDDAAAELGVDVSRLRRLIFVATSVMIGAAVSVSGIISFVGLIVPHMLRLALGSDHRLLIPASVLGGAAFLVLSDLVARTVIAPAEIPVGAITALCGGPFFVYMLRREGRKAIAL